MLRLSEIKLPLGHPPEAIAEAAIARLRIAAGDLISCTVFRRAHDARKKSAIALIYSLDVEVKDEAGVLKRNARDAQVKPTPDIDYRFVARAPATLSTRPLVIGAGPCGLFAALVLAQMGFRPIILERGKEVRARTKDTWRLWRHSVLDPESNVQYGEGGAGTFSDGKLYSQIKDPRHLGRKVLTEFVKAGAPPEILTEAKPHIGTFRLVKMVENMRADHRVAGRRVPLSKPRGGPGYRNRQTARGTCAAWCWRTASSIAADHVVLAIGHSARDTFQMLHDRGVYIEAKPFSIGFRIEHPQSLIDRARFGARRAIPTSARRITSWCITPRTAARCIASACAPAARWSRRPPRRARRHQRHEPVFPQRAQRQCRHRRRHHAGRLSRAGRWRASRFSASGKRAPSSPAAAPTPHLRSAWATLSPGGLDVARQGDSVLQARRHADRSLLVPAGLRDRRDPRSAHGVRPADHAASTWRMRC